MSVGLSRWSLQFLRWCRYVSMRMNEIRVFDRAQSNRKIFPASNSNLCFRGDEVLALRCHQLMTLTVVQFLAALQIPGALIREIQDHAFARFPREDRDQRHLLMTCTIPDCLPKCRASL